MPKWLTYSLVAIVLWGSWGIVAKKAAMPPLVLTIVSTLAVVAVALPLLLLPGLRTGNNLRKGMFFAFLTGICGNLGNLAALEAMNQGGQASIVYPFTSMYPIVTVVLARFFLREKLNAIQWAGILVALAAIGVFGYMAGQAEGPSGQVVRPTWMLYATVTLVLFGIAAVTQKVSTNHISNELSLVLFASAFVPVALLLLAVGGPFEWKYEARIWVYALLYGALIGLGTLALFAAYRWGSASVVTVLTGLYPALTVVLAMPLLAEALDVRKGVAIALALASGTALTWEKKKAEPGA